MAKCVWTFAFCLMSAAAMAQSPGDEDPGDRPRRAEEPRERRGARSDDDSAAEEGERGRGRGERGERGERGRGEDGGRFGMFRRPNPMFEAIDVNGDQTISNVELKKAIAALKKLDADGDGNITLAEASPQGGPGGMFGDPAQMVDRMMQRDQNGDGMLTPDEVDEQMAGMLRNADANQDGAISREELTASFQRFGRGGPGGGFGPGFGGGVSPEQMVQQMARLDRNGDGKLSPQEVPEQMRRMLQGRDTDRDGAISAQELEAAARAMGDRFGGRNFGPGGQGGPGGRDFGGRFDRGERGDRGGDEGEDEDRPSRRRRPETDE